MKYKTRSAVVLLPLLLWATVDTGRGADDARGDGAKARSDAHSGGDARGELPEAARERDRAVNLFLCANALPGCDEALLSPEQRARFMANRPAQR
jgi:hypothetical protein